MREDFHWTKCLELFNDKLSQPIQYCDRDPLWAAAAMLGVISFSSVDATVPQDAWPLNSAKSTHLDWLNISKGKMAVWDLVDPLRPESIFNVLREDYLQLFRPLPELNVGDIPAPLAKLCDLDEMSSPDNNPYWAAVQALLCVLDSPSDVKSVTHSLKFVGHMTDQFKHLLAGKDPVALLLMALWYSQVRGTVWWLDQRATVEGQAICFYLQTFHKDDEGIQQILKEVMKDHDVDDASSRYRRFELLQ